MYVGGQNIILKGKVIDGKTNKPIEYAHIRLKNSSIGTITNTLGIFSIALPAEKSKCLDAWIQDGRAIHWTDYYRLMHPDGT